ncbi:ArpU family phage packaging/lysis transcriptional regulator [Brevibacillus massiliensis]|uniref:ArpU family phage packaging/lysis transcriptional regulator n=1 Tax=Brevibacillus massiliensis TaxID=1118054 RepID=UPI00030E37D6|nr:ArpU family phage packaging/lysis transcriptional regulator [Brevibacillus massiliensis]
MQQLSFGDDFLPELDRKKTQKAVEAALSKYRLYKYLIFEEREAATTASYEAREGGRTNKISDQTAGIAVYNVDEQEKRKAYCERVERAVKRLPRMERFLIEERYMGADSEYITDYNIYNQRFNPPISEFTYYKIKWKAFYKIALALDIQVVKSEN